MGYIYDILKAFILVLGLTILATVPAQSQTCCSGGVPLSGNIGFEGAEQGALQMELSYDLNYLATLKDGSDVFTSETRKRVTQSVLLKAGYSVSDWLAVDALVTFVNQGRSITYQGDVSRVNTNGLGDAVVITKFILSRFSDNGTEVQLGAGPKIPFGATDLMDDRGITLNADLQPGSGSWDLITWGYFLRKINVRPTTAISVRVVGRINGTNKNYLGSQEYGFGNSYQLYLGLGDQFLIRNKVFSASISLRYRKAFADRINGLNLDNTGGQWINIIPSMSWAMGPNSLIHLIPEIPVMSRVEGIQLTPTFRIQVGLYHSFGGKKKTETKSYQL